MLPALPALISAGANILGGILGNKSKEKASRQEYARQKEFAQSGIQWKVSDAEKAGIHPLYALGAQTSSYAPQSAGGGDYDFLGSAGQNIGRAIDATRSNPAKAEALALTAAQLQLEGVKLDNDLKRTQLASAVALARQGANPGLPDASSRVSGIPGSGDFDRVMLPQQTPWLRAGQSRPYPVDKRWSDAQSYEDRYGEMSDYIMGPAIFAADLLKQRQTHFDRNVRPSVRIRNDRYYWDYKGAGRR